jgi:hypothetical protein
MMVLVAARRAWPLREKTYEEMRNGAGAKPGSLADIIRQKALCQQ